MAGIARSNTLRAIVEPFARSMLYHAQVKNTRHAMQIRILVIERLRAELKAFSVTLTFSIRHSALLSFFYNPTNEFILHIQDV
jgi:hypothetical protein